MRNADASVSHTGMLRATHYHAPAMTMPIANLHDHEAAAPRELLQALAAAAAQLAQRGWTPATSSNFSARVDAQRIAITVSGRDKATLGPDDFMLIGNDARPLDARQPSAETRLHTQIYAHWPQVGAVLHTHSLTQTVASLHWAAAGEIRLAGYELIKAIHGHDSHEQSLRLPVFANSQHMPDIEAAVDAWLQRGLPLHAYLIAGHGLYAWGRSIAEAMRHIEALEFMLACAIELRKLPS